MKSIKKLLCLILTTQLLVFTAVSAIASSDITVKIDGQQVDFDVPPQLINNRAMVPLRAIFEALGASVDWNDDTQTVISKKENTTIVLTIGNPIIYVNGSSVALDSPACVLNDRTLVPVRAISEAFGTNVYWDNEKNSVFITTNNETKTTNNNYTVSSDINNESSWSYYYNTNIPDYTIVTGVPMKWVYSDDGEIFTYGYEYTDVGKYAEMLDYMDHLYKNGWQEKTDDAKETYDSLTYYFTKNNELVSISYQAESDEVWITFRR